MRDGRRSRAHPAQHDALTGLANRGLAHARLEASLAASGASRRSFALVLLDVARFHALNAALGQAAGDAVLQELARRLARSAGPRECVARVGGDEFFVVLERTGTAAALDGVEPLLTRLTREFEIGGLRIPLEVCAGVAVHPDHGTDAATLLRRADLALRRAKRLQRRLVVYESGEEERQLRRLGIVQALRGAVAGDQLALAYQPKLEVRTRRIASAEALLRWRHPLLGATGPAEFIPLAEETGQIQPLTRWVLARVLQQMKDWRSRGLRVGAAVNLSALDLSAPDLPEAIAGLLSEHAADPSALTLEITESALMRHAEDAPGGLGALRALGVRVALDDFGVGFSSLSRLRRLPVDELKIDRSFVSGLSASGRERHLVRSIIELGQRLGLHIVAEGVEELATLRILEELGCDAVQGYAVSPPLEADAFAAMCDARRMRRRSPRDTGAPRCARGPNASA